MSDSRWAFMETLVIGPADDPYLTRLRVVSTPWLGLYVHRIHRPDVERHVHDHPWAFATLVYRGGYVEEFAADPRRRPVSVRRRWRRGTFHRMPLRVAHRIAEVLPGTVSVVVVGPKVRRWGFFTEDGWVPWDEYLADEYGTDRADRVVEP